MVFPTLTTTQRRALLAGLIVLMLVASRTRLMNRTSFDHDEVRSVWRTFGAPAQIILWQPDDWPPLYYLTVGAWRLAVGIHPLVLRFSSILWFALSLPLVFRLARRVFKRESAAWLSLLVHAALGVNIYLSVNLRGYALALALYPLAFWLTLRYFDEPEWWRGLMLGAALATLFYTTYTAVGAFLTLGVYTLFVYRRAVWRWWLPGVTALVIALPELFELWKIAQQRAVQPAYRQFLRAGVGESTLQLYSEFAGPTVVLFAGLALVGVVALLWKERPLRARTWALVVVLVAGPVLTYFSAPVLIEVTVRYAWWVALSLALLLGGALSYLPRPAMWMVGALLVGMCFTPFDVRDYDEDKLPYEFNLPWLAERIQSEDVIYLDPDCGSRCSRPEVWDYYERVYFPNGGLEFVDDPGGNYRRVWHVRDNADYRAETVAQLEDGRIESDFFGPRRLYFQLYEGPPDREGIRYENGMRFHGVDVLQDVQHSSSTYVRREGESIRVRLWWSADEDIELDYSVSVGLLDDVREEVLTQWDGSPPLVHLKINSQQSLPEVTSQWDTGGYYVSEHELFIPLPVPYPSDSQDQTFTLYLTVYQWWDGEIISAPGFTDNDLLPLRKLNVIAW